MLLKAIRLRISMKYWLILALLLLSSSISQGQVKPFDVISNRDFHENALEVEAERKRHLLDLAGLLQKLKSAENKIIIDLRGESSFKRKHIKGAINLPIEELTEKRLKEIISDPKAPIIIYCDNSFFPTRMIGLTTYAYPTLRRFGYENVFEIDSLWRNSMEAPKELEPYWESN